MLEETSQEHLVQSPAQSSTNFKVEQVAQSFSQSSFKCVQGWKFNHLSSS